LWLADAVIQKCLVVPFLRSTVASGVSVIDTPEVFEAADAVEAKLPNPAPGNNWGTVGDRLDEAMRSRLLELGKPVI
jgi:hypothetical protein